MNVRWARVWCFEILLTAIRAGVKVAHVADPASYARAFSCLWTESLAMGLLITRNLFSTILKNVMALGSSTNSDFPVVVRICHILLELLRMLDSLEQDGS